MTSQTDGYDHRAPGDTLGAQTQLWCAHHDHHSYWVLELTGEADLATVELLRRELRKAVGQNRRYVVLDATRLRFCDVGCAEVVLVTGRTTEIVLVGAQDAVLRVFELLDPLESVARYHQLSDGRLER